MHSYFYLLPFIFVSVFAYALHACMYEYSHYRNTIWMLIFTIWTCMCMCMWRPKVGVWCFPLHLLKQGLLLSSSPFSVSLPWGSCLPFLSLYHTTWRSSVQSIILLDAMISFKNILKHRFMCVYACVHVCGNTGAWHPEESVLSVHCVDPRNWNQVIRLSSKHFYSLSHLSSLIISFLWSNRTPLCIYDMFPFLVICCWADFIMLVNVSVTAVNMDVQICLRCSDIEYLVYIPEVWYRWIMWSFLDFFWGNSILFGVVPVCTNSQHTSSR